MSGTMHRGMTVSSSSIIGFAAYFSVMTWTVNINILSPSLQDGLIPILRWFSVGLNFFTTLLPSKYRSSKSHFQIGIYLAGIAASALFSVDQPRTLIEILRILSFIALFQATSTLPHQERGTVWRASVHAAWQCVVLSTALGLRHSPYSWRGDEWGLQRGRLVGIAVEPGLLGMLAAICASSILFPISHSASVSLTNRIYRGVGAVSCIYCLYGSESRTGEIIVTTEVLLWLARRVNWASTVRLRISASLSWLIGTGLVLGLVVPVVLGFTWTQNAGFQLQEGLNSIHERQFAWLEAAHMFLQRPVFGSGFGTGVTFLGIKSDSVSSFLYAHSLFLTYLANTGLIGTAAILPLYLTIGRQTLRGLGNLADKERGGPSQAELSIAAGFAVCICFSAVEGAMQGIYPSFVYVFVGVGFLSQPVVSRMHASRVRPRVRMA